jgi:hypothetical protein
MRPTPGVPRHDRELPVTAGGEHRDDLLDQRLGLAADQRRREPPRELDRLDVRKSRRVDAAHRREVAVLALERERCPRRHQRRGGGEDPGTRRAKPIDARSCRDLAIEVVGMCREVDRLHPRILAPTANRNSVRCGSIATPSPAGDAG